MHAYLNFGFKNQFFSLLFLFQLTYVSQGYNRVLEKISENCDFWSKMRFFSSKIRNFFFGCNCSSFILQLNAENRINIRAVYNEIHVSNFFCMEFIW